MEELSEKKNDMHGKMGLNSKLRLWNLLLWILKCHSIYFIRFIIQIETPRPKPCMRASFKPLWGGLTVHGALK